jgi:hypothetical protein
MNKLIVKFKNAYNFEGKEYDQVDLSGLENLKAKDLMEADKVFISSGDVAAMNEMNLKYNSIIAANVTKLPVEFFEELPAKEAIKVKNVVAGFLLDEE